MEIFADVSQYQKDVDWKKYKKMTGDFAIFRSILKSGKEDAYLKRNILQAKKHDISFDIYLFLYDKNLESAESTCRKLSALIEKYELSDKGVTFWLDIEFMELPFANTRKMTEIIQMFKKCVENHGMDFGIYTGYYLYKNYVAKCYTGKYWIARYYKSGDFYANRNGSITKIDMDRQPDIYTKDTLVAWQYTSRGHVPGISVLTDLNILLL